jgi:hypothetical protein
LVRKMSYCASAHEIVIDFLGLPFISISTSAVS